MLETKVVPQVVVLLWQNFAEYSIFKKKEIQLALLLHISLSPNLHYIELARSTFYL